MLAAKKKRQTTFAFAALDNFTCFSHILGPVWRGSSYWSLTWCVWASASAKSFQEHTHTAALQLARSLMLIKPPLSPGQNYSKRKTLSVARRWRRYPIFHSLSRFSAAAAALLGCWWHCAYATWTPAGDIDPASPCQLLFRRCLWIPFFPRPVPNQFGLINFR